MCVSIYRHRYEGTCDDFQTIPTTVGLDELMQSSGFILSPTHYTPHINKNNC